MALESATHISDLVTTNPVGATDTKATLDDHIRLIKSVLKTDFANITGAVTPTHTELNYVDGVTSAIQGQLDAKAPLASPTLTGTPLAPTAAAGTSTTQIATTAFVAGTAFSSALPAQTGNSGKYVTTDGTTASWATVPVAGMYLLATLTPTAAANVDALSTFTASYDNYLIIGQGILPATDAPLLMQLGAAGSADAGSNYYSNTEGAAFTSSATSHGIAQGATNVLAAGKGMDFRIDVLNANDATNAKAIISDGVWQAIATPSYFAQSRMGLYVAANAASGIRFFWSGGQNFAATGKIRIYGYNNA